MNETKTDGNAWQGVAGPFLTAGSSGFHLPASAASDIQRGMILLLTLLCVSCAGNRRKPVFPARGQVVFDGKPAAGATVFFQPVVTEPDGIAPYAVTDANGAFRLTTYLTYDGAPAAEYVVTVRYPGPPRRGRDEDSGPD